VFRLLPSRSPPDVVVRDVVRPGGSGSARVSYDGFGDHDDARTGLGAPAARREMTGAPAATRGVSLGLDAVTHRFGQTVAVDGVSLSVAPGEIVALLGPSGCGKTTLLRVVAGLLRQTDGHVAIGGEVVDDLPPNERGAGIVFQNYALFPHMTVEANVAYGLRARGTARREIAARVPRMLELVRMQGFERRWPRELSGGQQQRVALARTLAVSPRVLLLDEPFGALDKNLRLDMQIEVKRLQRELDITTIMVTHDQEEALSLADRIAVMSRGRVEQFATPEGIYDRPTSLFVATFVGTANLLRGKLSQGGRGYVLEIPGTGELALSGAQPHDRPGAVVVSIRPEHVQFVSDGEPGLNAHVELVLPLGPAVIYDVVLEDGTPVKVTTGRMGRVRHGPGEAVRIGLVPHAPVSVFAE
jgi:putative spermidine/putrescine transport system ATP-binding protein